VGDYQWVCSQALLAHATQVDPNEGFWFALADEELTVIYPWEDWILARSLIGPVPADDSERDLFAGVRAPVDSEMVDR